MKKTLKDINIDLGTMPDTTCKLWLECLSVGLCGKMAASMNRDIATHLDALKYQSRWLDIIIKENNESI